VERAHFERDLAALREHLGRMARIAVQAVEQAVTGFVERRGATAIAVHAAETALNELQMTLDDRAMRLVALQQPTARDLRLILASIRANVDLERVGDHAVNLTQLSTALAGRQANPVEPTIVGMAELALGMLRDAASAFVSGDVALARDVLARDEVQDREFRSVFPVVISQLREGTATADVGVRLLLFARNLERVADHATNIAEQAIFLVEARDVRHGHGA
jgi:phosphate transport system protein